jgi:serine/threonine protein kinase
MREAFLADVGFTVLNLSKTHTICHNDIRPTNIAFSNNRFCLLDFDLSRKGIVKQANSSFSPDLSSVMLKCSQTERIICYSVAQIAVNVFMLSSVEEFKLDEVSKAKLIWLKPSARVPDLYEPKTDIRHWLRESLNDPNVVRVDKAFHRWVQSKGEPLLGFIDLVRNVSIPPLNRSTSSQPNLVVSDTVSFPTDYTTYFVEVLKCMLK